MKKNDFKILYQNNLKNFIVILILVTGIIMPSFISIRDEIEKKVTSKLIKLDLVGEMVKGTRFEEKIYLPKYVRKYGIMFGTYSRKNKGLIKVEIIQGNKKINEIIDMSKLKDNDYYYLNLKFSKLHKGEAFLKIEGIDGKKGSSASMHKTDDILYGELFQNGEKTGKSLVHKIEFSRISNTAKIQIIFLIIVIILFSCFLKLIQNEEKNNKKIYIITVLIIFFLINIKAPVIMIQSQPYAEQIFNFVDNGINKNFVENLFIMDAGYWPLYQRLIGLFIIKLGLNFKWTVLLMSSISILIMASMISIFVLNYYKKYGSVLFRFILCIVLGAFNILPYTETHTFINFSYMNIVLIFYISLIDFNNIGKKKYVFLTILTGILCISKAHYVIFIPLITLVLIFFWKKQSKREKIFLFTTLVSLVIQLLYTKRNAELWIKQTNEKPQILEIFNVGTHQIVQQFMNLFYPGISQNQNVLNLNIYFLFLLISLIFYILYLNFKNKNRESLLLLFLALSIFGNAYFNVISQAWINKNLLWSETIGSINSRHASLIKLSFILIIVLLMNEFKNNKNIIVKKIFDRKIEFVVILILVSRYSVLLNDTMFKYDEIYSDWKIYSKFYEVKEYVIPVEPYFLSKNKKVYYFLKTKNPKFIMSNEVKETFYMNEADEIQEIILPKPIKIEYLYTKRVRNYNFDKIKLIGFDKNNNIILELIQLNNKERSYIGFKNNDPDKDIVKISFVNERNKKAYVIPEIIIGEPIK